MLLIALAFAIALMLETTSREKIYLQLHAFWLSFGLLLTAGSVTLGAAVAVLWLSWSAWKSGSRTKSSDMLAPRFLRCSPSV